MKYRCDQNNVQNFLDFLQNAPADEEIIRMDCDDFCDEVSQLAERVANGEDLTHILPTLEDHMKHWSGCREEFEALVAILKAEKAAKLAPEPESNDNQQTNTEA